jgi:hypothetical protein
MLKDLFTTPPTCRGSKKGREVDTTKVLRNLRKAVQDHLLFNPNSHYGQQLIHMLNNTGYHDPGEAWNLLYGIVREELGIAQDNSHIGIKIKQRLACTRCKSIRVLEDVNNQYMHQALELVALNSTSNPSVQEAIQHFFLPHDLEVRCCDGTRDITHKKQFWCEKGDAGVVFY